MNGHSKGMAHYLDQEKDRKRWNEAIQERKQLITKLLARGIKLKNPHSMKMSDLRALAEEGQ